MLCACKQTQPYPIFSHRKTHITFINVCTVYVHGTCCILHCTQSSFVLFFFSRIGPILWLIYLLYKYKHVLKHVCNFITYHLVISYNLWLSRVRLRVTNALQTNWKKTTQIRSLIIRLSSCVLNYMQKGSPQKRVLFYIAQIFSRLYSVMCHWHITLRSVFFFFFRLWFFLCNVRCVPIQVAISQTQEQC